MFLCIFTRGAQFYLFRYNYIQGFGLETKSEIANAFVVKPFFMNEMLFLMAATNASIAKIYKPIILGAK